MTNINHISNDSRELSILASLYGLSFILKNPENNTRTFFEYPFAPTNPDDLQTKLESIFKERDVLKHRFQKVNIIHHNMLNTFIPDEIFDENLTKEYLELNTKLLPGDFIDHDYKVSHHIHNIFVPFVNINNSFLNQNKEIHYTHSFGVFLEKASLIRQKQELLPVFDIYINVYPYDFQILIFQNEKIRLFNHFEYSNIDDFLYYVFFVIETVKISDKQAKYHISGISEGNEIIDNLKDFNPDIHIIPSLNDSKINNFW